MKNLNHPCLAPYRSVDNEMRIVGSTGHPKVGFFIIPSALDRKNLRCVVSAVEGWDHVSVSRTDRVPNWYEMCQIKELFFEENEDAMQLHPPRSEWVNNHPHCLHLWRCHSRSIPRPPASMVGVQHRVI